MRAIIYTRTSSITERQTNDRQVADLQSYAAANDIEVVKVFNEKISGAAKNEERTVLMSCLEYAEVNCIDIILCSELSRVGRAIWQVLETVKHCIDKKINIFFQKENLHILKVRRERGRRNGNIYKLPFFLCRKRARKHKVSP